jgi:hypothetical protein
VTHQFRGFANPYLHCDRCDVRVTRWHDPAVCGCDQQWWNEPCGHTASVTSVCPSWAPDGHCSCRTVMGYTPHIPRHEQEVRL